jgi:hypothetical protein
VRYFEGNLAKILQGTVEEILIADDDWFWTVTNQSCGCNSVILKINGKIIRIVHDRETIAFTDIPSYDAELETGIRENNDLTALAAFNCFR